MNDLISRSALRKELRKKLCPIKGSDVYFVRQLIDNAPPVEITEEQAIDKLHETGWMQRHDKEMTKQPTRQVNCCYCDYLNFSEKIIDIIVKVMTKYGIERVEDLHRELDRLRGGETNE